MGNKETKKLDAGEFGDPAVNLGEDSRGKQKRKMSKEAEALAECLASLSNMANTGVDPSLLDLPLPGRSDITGNDITPRTVRRMSVKLKQKLHSQLDRVSHDAIPIQTSDMEEMLDNLDLQDSPQDSKEWTQMRSWLVWCMHNNLTETEDENEGLPIVNHAMGRHHGRKMSVDHHSRIQQRRLSYQTALDIKDGKMSAQSSIESNAET